MAVRSQFFDSVNGDRVYDAEEFSQHLNKINSDGIIQDNDTDSLRVSPTSPGSLAVEVGFGSAFIQGRFVEVFDSPEELTIEENTSGSTRTDGVFAQLNFLNREVRFVVKAGDISFIRDSTVWELRLARVQVPDSATEITGDDIFDDRADLFACGKSKPTTLRQNFQNVTTTAEWKRIAVTNGLFTGVERKQDAHAMFVVRSDETVSVFGGMHFIASFNHNRPTLSLLHRGISNASDQIEGLRITYDGNGNGAVEVLVTSTSVTRTFEIYDNYSMNGWFPVNWTTGASLGTDVELDLTTPDIMQGFATDDGSYSITRDGEITLENDKSLQGKETDGTLRSLIKMNASDLVEIGTLTNVNVALNSLRFNTNNTGLIGRTGGGADRALIKMNTDNEVEVGDPSARTLFVNTMRLVSGRAFQGVETDLVTAVNMIAMSASNQVTLGASTNTTLHTGSANVFINLIRITTNNASYQGAETGGANRNLIKMNTSDEVEIGSSTNENVIPNTMKLSVNNTFLQGVQTDGTTFRNLIGLNNFNNIVVGSPARQLVLLSLGLGPQFFDGVNFHDIFHAGYVQPQVRAFHSVDQSIANAVATALQFNSERWDTDTMHDNVTDNSRLTAMTDGLYQIDFSGEWDTNATGQRQFFIQVNGTTPIAVVRHDASGASTTQQNLSTQYQLSAGDFVEVFAFQNSGGALNIITNPQFSPEFSMSFVSPI